jgi:hypothetical protein
VAAIIDPNWYPNQASHLRRSYFQHLSQPPSAASAPAGKSAFAAPGASPGVLGTKGGVVGHCSHKDDQLVLSRSQFVNSTVEVVCTCPNNSQSWMPTEGLRRLEFPICGP